jgi:predicted nucleic acid-binding protein
MATFTVIYDACVLYSAPLRDILMWLSITDLFRARWTEAILDEWSSNLLVNRPDLKPERIENTRRKMNESTLDCLITGYEDLIEGLQLPDPDDRHVLAAAIRAQAGVIVTFNLNDFPSDYLAQFGVEAQHPDDFIMDLIDLSPGSVCMAAKQHRANLRKPPKTVDEYLDTLEQQQLPKTVQALRKFEDLI